MDKSWKKDAKRRVADVVEDIIKMTSKEEIIMFVRNQSLDLDNQFQNPDLIKQINDSQNEMLFTPVLGGKHKGEIAGSVVTLENHFKVFEKDLKKYLKLVKKMDKKSLNALFSIHIHDLALIAIDNKKIRELLKIKGGIFS